MSLVWWQFGALMIYDIIIIYIVLSIHEKVKKLKTGGE